MTTVTEPEIVMSLTFHDVCKIFPLMAPDEFAGLKADIQATHTPESIHEDLHDSLCD